MNIGKYLLQPNETWKHFFKECTIFWLKGFVGACAIIGILSMLRIIIW